MFNKEKCIRPLVPTEGLEVKSADDLVDVHDVALVFDDVLGKQLHRHAQLGSLVVIEHFPLLLHYFAQHAE